MHRRSSCRSHQVAVAGRPGAGATGWGFGATGLVWGGGGSTIWCCRLASAVGHSSRSIPPLEGGEPPDCTRQMAIYDISMMILWQLISHWIIKPNNFVMVGNILRNFQAYHSNILTVYVEGQLTCLIFQAGFVGILMFSRLNVPEPFSLAGLLA